MNPHFLRGSHAWPVVSSVPNFLLAVWSDGMVDKLLNVAVAILLGFIVAGIPAWFRERNGVYELRRERDAAIQENTAYRLKFGPVEKVDGVLLMPPCPAKEGGKT